MEQLPISQQKSIEVDWCAVNLRSGSHSLHLEYRRLRTHTHVSGVGHFEQTGGKFFDLVLGPFLFDNFMSDGNRLRLLFLALVVYLMGDGILKSYTTTKTSSYIGILS